MKQVLNKNTPNGDFYIMNYLISFKANLTRTIMNKARNAFISILLLIILPFIETNCQEFKLPIYQKGRIYFEDGTSLNYSKLLENNDSVLCYTSSNLRINLAKENIYKIQTKGNHALELGAGCTLAGILMSVIITSSWDEPHLEDAKPTFYAIMIPTFAFSGIITGLFWPKYKTVYLKNPNFSFAPYYEYNKINHCSNYGIKITIRINN